LNIGPRADGTIPEQDAEMLRSIGRWLEVNGEAIYASRPWKVSGEGPTRVASGNFTDAREHIFTSQDIRFTTRGETLYAIFLAWPGNGSVVITSLGEQSSLYPASIVKVELLGSDKPLSWVREAAGLRVELPADKPCEYAGVLKITA
jgi:alpha-L-fucosidase